MNKFLLGTLFGATALLANGTAHAYLLGCNYLVNDIKTYIEAPVGNKQYHAIGTVAVMEPGSKNIENIAPYDTDDKAVGMIYYNEAQVKVDGDGIMIDTGVADRNTVPGLTGVAWHEPNQKLSLRFRLSPDGQVSYEKTLNGVSIGNAPPVYGQATCTSDGQVTGILSNNGDPTSATVRTFIASFRFGPWEYITK